MTPDGAELIRGAGLIRTSLEKREKYWLNAFDEWYITRHKQGGLRAYLGVYRPLWDDYYENALTQTARNPAMMVALWSALHESKIAVDEEFVTDMWSLLRAGERRAALDELVALHRLLGKLSMTERVGLPPYIETALSKDLEAHWQSIRG